MPSSNSSPTPTLKIYLGFTLVFLTLSILLIPRYYGVPYPKPAGPLFDSSIKLTYKLHMAETNPKVVLLGDSTLEDSINESLLTELLGVETYRLSNPGSASAVWYLILKNNVLAAPVKPEQVIIFSRASMLTTPEYRTTGKYVDSIVEVALPEDTLVTELSYLSHMSWLEKNLDRYLPVFGYRARVRKSLEDLLKYRISGQLLGLNRKEVDASFDDVFGSRELVQLSNMITMAEAYLHEEERLDFHGQLPNSYLPEIVRLCAENDIQLTLVYTQTIYEEQDAETAQMLAEYRSDLFAYAAENNIQVLDYLGDERLQGNHFNDPVHMNPSGKAVFTEIFAADFAKFLP